MVAKKKKARKYIVAAVNYNFNRKAGAAYDAVADGKLGSVYTAVTEALLARGNWSAEAALLAAGSRVPRLPEHFHLLLGMAQGSGIPFAQLPKHRKSMSDPVPLVNYYMNCACICNKARLVQTLRDWAERDPMRRAPLVSALIPPSFTFCPSRPPPQWQGERSALRRAYADAALAPDCLNAWILKPAGASHGEGIVIAASLADIERFVAPGSAAAGEATWVVQQYVDPPLLLPGRRKFDLRCWVLLDANMNAFLYREGVLRVCATAYDPAQLSDRYSHLTNHSIAAEHPDYGKYEAGNEMFYSSFDAFLSDAFPSDPRARLPALLAQVKEAVRRTVEAAQEELESGPRHAPQQPSVPSFNLFGFDFMVDADFMVWLVEVNASPAVADRLLPGLVESLIAVAIDPVCEPPPDSQAGAGRDAAQRFELLWGPGLAQQQPPRGGGRQHSHGPEAAGEAAGEGGAAEASSRRETFLLEQRRSQWAQQDAARTSHVSSLPPLTASQGPGRCGAGGHPLGDEAEAPALRSILLTSSSSRTEASEAGSARSRGRSAKRVRWKPEVEEDEEDVPKARPVRSNADLMAAARHRPDPAPEPPAPATAPPPPPSDAASAARPGQSGEEAAAGGRRDGPSRGLGPAHGRSHVEAHGRSHAEAHGRSNAEAHERSKKHAHGQSHVEGFRRSHEAVPRGAQKADDEEPLFLSTFPSRRGDPRVLRRQGAGLPAAGEAGQLSGDGPALFKSRRKHDPRDRDSRQADAGAEEEREGRQRRARAEKAKKERSLSGLPVSGAALNKQVAALYKQGPARGRTPNTPTTPKKSEEAPIRPMEAFTSHSAASKPHPPSALPTYAQYSHTSKAPPRGSHAALGTSMGSHGHGESARGPAVPCAAAANQMQSPWTSPVVPSDMAASNNALGSPARHRMLVPMANKSSLSYAHVFPELYSSSNRFSYMYP